MAVKAYNPFVAGPRLINGTHLNNLFQGNESMQSINVSGATTLTGAVTMSGGTNITGNVTATGYIAQSVATAVTATGSTRAGAVAITHQITNMTTVAASTGAVLPAGSTVGTCAPIVIFNSGASAATIYAAGADTIDATAGSTGVTLTNAKRCAYYPLVTTAGTTTWISGQLGATSA